MDLESLNYIAKKNCEICNKIFGIIRIRHACKRCRLIICAACTKVSSIIVGFYESFQIPHKICTICQSEEEFQNQFRSMNNASWNVLSKIGQKWIQLPEVSTYITSLNHDFNYYLNRANKLKDSVKSIQEINLEANRGRFDKEFFNYPMMEYLHYSQLNLSQDSIRGNVKNILKAFSMKFKSVGYQYGIGHLAIFLLSLLDESNTFNLLSYIVESILPSQFYEKDIQLNLYGYQIENFLIYKLVSTSWSLSKPSEIQALLSFFEDIELPMIQILLIDCVNFENLLFIWNRVLEQNNFREFEKYLLSILDHVKTNIFDKASEFSFSKFQIHLCRHLNLKTVERHMSEIPNEMIDTKYDDIFIKNCSQAWISIQNDYYLGLQRFSLFSVNDIRYILENAEEKYLKIKKKGKLKADICEKIIFDRQEFLIFLTEILPIKLIGQDVTPDIAEKFFYFIDFDYKRKISMTHFITTLFILNGDRIDEKLALAYNFFDNANKGYLEPREFKKFTISITDSMLLLRRLIFNPFYTRDLIHLRLKIGKITKKLEIINKNYVDIEGFLKDSYLNYFSLIGKVGTLKIIGQHDIDSDYEFLGPNYQRNLTVLAGSNQFKNTQDEFINNNYDRMQTIIIKSNLICICIFIHIPYLIDPLKEIKKQEETEIIQEEIKKQEEIGKTQVEAKIPQEEVKIQEESESQKKVEESRLNQEEAVIKNQNIIKVNEIATIIETQQPFIDIEMNIRADKKNENNLVNDLLEKGDEL